MARRAGGRSGAPNGIRIRAAGLKGRCPRPLDDGGTRTRRGIIPVRERGGSRRGSAPFFSSCSSCARATPARGPRPPHQCLRCLTPAPAARSGAAPRGVATASPSALATSPTGLHAFLVVVIVLTCSLPCRCGSSEASPHQPRVLNDTWPRLKACREDTCRWAFYDHSKNRSGHWCSMEVCGARHKARQYRARHKAG